MSEAALKSQSLVLFHVKYSCGISGAAVIWRRELNPCESIESLSFKKTSCNPMTELHCTEYNYQQPAYEEE